MATWRSEEQLRHHFERHQRELGVGTLADYDASAQDALDVGVYFEFFHDDAAEWHTGCYDVGSGRLTVLNASDRIVTHFRCTE